MTTSRTTLSIPRVAALFAAAALAAGCATRTPAPVVDRPAVPPRAAPSTAPLPPPHPAAATKPGEPDWRPPTYTVKRGDTLYQIALEHGLDYRDLAAWNGIENINVIRVGQALRLTAPGSEPPQMAAGADAGAPGTTVTPLRTVPPVTAGAPRSDAAGVASGGAPVPPAVASASVPPTAAAADRLTKTSPKAIKEPWSEQAMRDVARLASAPDTPAVKPPAPPPTTIASAPQSSTTPSNAAASAAASVPATTPPAPGPSPGDDEGLDWVWPAKGKVVAQFSESASLKGIDIGGAAGDPVVASAPGKVVYAGSGLRGYGKLVIIKHNATYLTAYAHNADILVKEGQAVARGQKIAEMGSTDADRVKLHFEIRRLGKPMDPLRFLPPA